MLTVRRRVFSGLLGERLTEVDLGATRPDVELDSCTVGTTDGLGEADGARSFEVIGEGDGMLGVSDGTGKFVLDFGIGKGGRAVVGGFVAGRNGCGSAEAIPNLPRISIPYLSLDPVVTQINTNGSQRWTRDA
jgi:hypothetical protein